MSSEKPPKKVEGYVPRENVPQQCFFQGRASKLQALLDKESKLAQSVYDAANALKAAENRK